MRDIEELMPFVLPYATTCPEPTAAHHLRSAARKFCDRTRLWRHEEANVTVLGTHREIQIIPQGAELLELRQALFDDVEVEPVSLAEIQDRLPAWRTATGLPRYITQERVGYFTLAPIQAGTLTVSMLLRPTIYADTLPDFMVDQYAETLAHGALGEILFIPDQSFTNYKLGTDRRQQFSAALDRLCTAAVKGQHRAPVRSRARFI